MTNITQAWYTNLPLNSDQRKVLKYFVGTGCLGSIGKMNDEQYENMVQTRLNNLNSKKRALEKIGLDEDQLTEISPVFFHGYDTGDRTLYKEGADDVWRSSKYGFTWLFFSSTQVYMYSYTFDMITDGIKEITEEYFYKDIVNFSSSSESIQVSTRAGCLSQPKSVMRDYSKFSIVVPGEKFTCPTSRAVNADASIAAMKQKLREKKEAK